MDKLTTKEATEYINSNYGRARHNIDCIVRACKYVAEVEELNAVDLFHLLIENRPVPNVHTHSYGFQTTAGRYLINAIQQKYYEQLYRR
jgi:hypothetical protein